MGDDNRGVLREYTTLRLGGPARTLITATDRVEIIEWVRELDRRDEPILVLAGGSNVVIGDDGFAGTVLLLRNVGITVRPLDKEIVELAVAAGHPWDDVVAYAVAERLSGLECLSGIPGSAGATPIQNVGAYGQEVAAIITGVEVYDRHSGTVGEMSPGDCQFAYRTSVLKHNDRYLVLSVRFRLRRSADSVPLRYAELTSALGLPAGGQAPLASVREAVLKLRAGKGMVLDPADPDTYSVGSFFTNPVLAAPAYQALLHRVSQLFGPQTQPPAWPQPDESIKVSAAWLIERAGFGKGYAGSQVGVAVSSKHTLALTNRGSGTTTALIALAREIRDGVEKTFDVGLLPEPVLVGCAL